MNISIELHNFSLVNINFLDTKRNIIMDGNFTKIIYSNQWFTINSIYIHFPIEILSIDKNINKSFLRFNPYSTKNLQIIQDIVKIESRILEYFKKFFNLELRTSNMLSKQLYTGNMKIFKEYVDKNRPFHGETSFSKSDNDFQFNRRKERFSLPMEESIEQRGEKIFVIKISGIWDNYEELGLTYKLLEVNSTVW